MRVVEIKGVEGYGWGTIKECAREAKWSKLSNAAASNGSMKSATDGSTGVARTSASSTSSTFGVIRTTQDASAKLLRQT